MGMGNGGNYGEYGEYGTAAAEKVVESANNFFLIILLISIISYVVVAIGSIFLCRYLAKSKNLSTNYMWLGLLSFIGVIIVALIPARDNYYPYEANAMYNNQYMYNNQNMNSNPQGTYINVQGVPQVLICPFCGAPLEHTDVVCNKCGNRVR